VASTALVVVFLAVALGGYYFWSVDREQQRLDEQILAETGELLGVHNQLGAEQLARAIRERLALEQANDSSGANHFYLFLESDTRVSVGNVADWPEGIQAGDAPQTLTLNSKDLTGEATILEHKARVRVEFLQQGGRLLVGQNLQSSADRQEDLRYWLILVGMGVLLLAVTTGLLMSRSLLKRVEQMNATILRILEGNRHERMPYRTPGDEFDELSHHFDVMLDENERLVTGMRSVTSDIAHDLRTPLARVQQRIDVALAGDGDSSELRQTLKEIHSDTARVLATFHELLQIAQIESGNLQERMVAVDLASVVANAVDLYQPLVEESGLQLELAVDPCLVLGNEHLLAQVCTNLLDNAVKYVPAPGKITVRLYCEDQTVHLVVADTGPGIPQEEREHVLERFVRLEESRSRPGTGLGLSFVKAVAELHDAQLELADAAPGLIVELTFAQVPQQA
jgi:signal transduction histidine kinase